MLTTDNRRANGHLFMCTDTGFYGQCQNVAFNLGTCCTETMALSSFIPYLLTPPQTTSTTLPGMPSAP
jgi:hypothetical protein